MLTLKGLQKVKKVLAEQNVPPPYYFHVDGKVFDATEKGLDEAVAYLKDKRRDG